MNESARRYQFLIDFTKKHPLSNGRRGFSEMLRLKAELTGLKGKALQNAVAQDIHNNGGNHV
jgi:hypothetical protein